MKLEDFGYNDELEKFRIDNHLERFEVGRVIAEHKERYIVKTTKGEFESEITGNMHFTAKSRIDFPAVGDWVALTTYEPDFGIIHQLLPRFSTIKRQAVGQFGEVQIHTTPRLSDSGNSLSRSVNREGVVGFASETRNK
jgi:ribosome biogenesis GTPase